MKEKISRRKLITTGLAAVGGLSGVAVAAKIASKCGLIPPDCKGLYGAGATLTYASQRLLTRHSLAREFPRYMISKAPFANGKPPELDDFKKLQAGGFADWRLEVDGMVAHPGSFSIDVQGRPDGIIFEPLTKRIYVLSHSQPNATVIDSKDGSVVGTIDLGGAPEQSASDGQGHLYVDLEDKDQIAVVDVNTMKVTAHYDLGGKGGGPGGLGLDAKNRVLFAFCHEPATAVILNADDGKIITTLPIGNGTDGGGFNPSTMEAFSSQGDGTLTIIKETSPTTFEVEQTVQTKRGAKTCTLDTKNNQILLITLERPATPPPAAGAATPPPGAGGGERRGGDRGGPALLDILVVGH